MATLEEGLFTYLSTNADVSALIGTRVFPLRMPERSTFPAIAYTRISGAREASHSGTSNLANSRVQISCWDRNYLTAKQVAQAVVKAMHAYSGAMGSITVYAAFCEDETDSQDEGTNLHRVIVDFSIWHKEAL